MFPSSESAKTEDTLVLYGVLASQPARTCYWFLKAAMIGFEHVPTMPGRVKHKSPPSFIAYSSYMPIFSMIKSLYSLINSFILNIHYSILTITTLLFNTHHITQHPSYNSTPTI